MNVVFRVDASLQIGTGHVIRCLTLAGELKRRGAVCRFVCRQHVGNLLDFIRQRGFEVISLPSQADLHETSPVKTNRVKSEYASWLGTDWWTDCEQTLARLHSEKPHWLVVDHYAIDNRWERSMRPGCLNLMVMDDLANRDHDCDLLLDQNLGRQISDYTEYVPDDCTVLAGARFALLRPEFARLRDYSLKRRAKPRLRHLLIAMGGVDEQDTTSQVLEALGDCSLPEDCRITIVMGANAPWIARVCRVAERMSRSPEIRMDVNDMAELMADSDLAIGAAGSMSWERCCMGLPSILITLAENQRWSANALRARDAIVELGSGQSLASSLNAAIVEVRQPDRLGEMSAACSEIVDGRGADRVVPYLQ